MWLGVYTKGTVCLSCFVSPRFIISCYWPLLVTGYWVGWFWIDAVWRSSTDNYPTDDCSSCSCCVYFSWNIVFTVTMLKKPLKSHWSQFCTVSFCDGLDLLKVSFYISYRMGSVCIVDGLSQVIKTFCDMLHSAGDNPVLKWEFWVKKIKSNYLII